MRKAVSADTYIQKIKMAITRTRFSQLKMDDIAKIMDISKVTLYKHFSSKEEIIQQVVAFSIRYLEDYDISIHDESVPFIERFNRTFFQAMSCVYFFSDLLIQDLKESYPAQYEELMAALQLRNQRLQAFYISGMEQGAFHRLNAKLIPVQDDAMLRRFMEPSFSIHHNVTLKQALVDYYRMRKVQVLKPELFEAADDKAVEEVIDRMLKNIYL